MLLKRLELVGFKTFADATELRFDRGVTGIIGPNGSGKSNCADALLWVLAERRLSALRASDTADVIFAGSGQRRPLGFAEVSLTVENDDGLLPIDLREVTVTRRLFRNGEAEYRINGRRCRRKDVVDLFLDTGVGRQAFTVISQREIDALLSIDPADRRRMLEEVAGIERYRTRREETLHRLQEVGANLTRLGDLMVGLELQLEPLGRQKTEAEAFLALRGRAEALRLSLLVKDYQLVERRLLKSDEELDSLRAALVAAEAAVAEADAAEQRARLEQVRLDESLTQAHAALGEAASAAEAQRGQLRLGEERLANLAQRLAESADSLRRQDEALDRLVAEDRDHTAEADQVAAELAAGRERAGALESRHRELLAAEERAGASAATQRQEWHAIEKRVSAAESARAAARRGLQVADERRAAAERRREQAVAARDEATARLATATAELAAVQATQAAGREAEQAATAELAELDRDRSQARDRLAELQGRLGETAGRLEVRRHAAESYQGLYAGVKAVLEARDRGRLRGEYEVVADLLEVAPGCDVAIEAALGARLQDLVCASGDDAREAIEYLKQGRSGRATFLPLDLLEAGDPPRQADRLRRMPGVVGLGLDLVSTAPEYEVARRHLLASLVVVETIDAGIAVRRAGFDRVTIVSLDGDVVRTSGSITGGSRDQGRPTLLTQRREMDELERQLDRLEAELASLKWDLGRAGEAQEAVRARLKAARDELEAQRKAFGEADRARLKAQSAQAQAEAEVRRADEALEELARDVEQARATIAEAQAELVALEARQGELRQHLEGAEAQVLRARADRATDAEALSAARVTVARLESRLDALREAARQQERARQAAVEERARLERHRAVWERERHELKTSLRALRRAVEEHDAVHREQAEAAVALQAMRQDSARQLDEAVAAARRTRTALVEAREAQHRAELRRTQVDGDLEHLRQTLAEEHPGLSVEQARARAFDLPNRQEAAEELQSLRAQMEALGDVNLGAIEEFERLTQQLRFYDRQKADLEAARDDLLLVIADIDAVTTTRLADAFVAVNREFDQLFRRVFGDEGEAGLVWTDPENLLDSGVEVLVRLPGKRTQNILLLSGGERAMTTVTLLLAMFRVKPSPFCLLDELDAPLDDANLRKYRELLREFSTHSQFIVITHNPETTRAADVLYGITMQEPGVSKAFSYRPPSEDEVEPDESFRAAD